MLDINRRISAKKNNGNSNIIGKVADKSLAQIEEWATTVNDGLDYGPIINGLVAKEFEEFRKWLKKKKDEEQQCGTAGNMG